MGARGQTEVIGVVLLLAITVIGAGVVVTAAGSALDGAQDRSAVQRAEQSMSLFDAQAALVALGRSDGQSVSLAQSGSGAYHVDSDSGRLLVIREDSDGNRIGNPIVDTSLGSVVYEHGNTEVAYQGGGVWRSTGAGAEMVSPPEFNYQGATLTLPVIRVAGGPDMATGGATARVTASDIGDQMFPKASEPNPLQNGTVTVVVQSEYHRGWKSFFEERTTGTVVHDAANETVELELVARGTGGSIDFQSPPTLRGLASENPVDSLMFTLEPNTKKASDFSDLNWSLVADNGGSDYFELNIKGADVCGSNQPDVTLTYTDSGTTNTWTNGSAFSKDGSTFAYSCMDDGTPRLHLDLTGTTNLTHQSGPASGLNNSTGALVNHVLAEMGPNVDLTILSKGKENPSGNSASLDFEASTGNIDYSASGSRVVTFLHVTENTVNVTLS